MKWPVHISWKTIAATISLALVPLLLVYIMTTRPGGLESEVRSLGYYPVRPPVVLSGPGSLIHVSWTNGRLYFRTVCTAEKVLQQENIDLRNSPSEEITATSLIKESYKIDAVLTELIGLKFGSEYVKNVSYNLKDVSILELPYSDLKKVEKILVMDEYCIQAIDELVNAHEFVCQGQEVLIASAEYVIDFDENLIGSGEDRDLVENIVDNVKKNIEEQSKSSAIVVQNTIRTGQQLHYGLKIKEFCIAPQGTTSGRPMKLPTSSVGWMLHYLRN